MVINHYRIFALAAAAACAWKGAFQRAVGVLNALHAADAISLPEKANAGDGTRTRTGETPTGV